MGSFRLQVGPVPQSLPKGLISGGVPPVLQKTMLTLFPINFFFQGTSIWIKSRTSRTHTYIIYTFYGVCPHSLSPLWPRMFCPRWWYTCCLSFFRLWSLYSNGSWSCPSFSHCDTPWYRLSHSDMRHGGIPRMLLYLCCTSLITVSTGMA